MGEECVCEFKGGGGGEGEEGYWLRGCYESLYNVKD